MRACLGCITVIALVGLFSRVKGVPSTTSNLAYKEKWNYVDVRPKAHMFWWLYYVEQAQEDRPLVMWLQGGPGASGTGFGNFQEIGPKDTDNNFRNSTWLQYADLLFVDNPVGTGFSYVDDDSAFTTNIDQIVDDLLTLFKAFLEANPQYKSKPFFIFCESYGGKMTAAFGVGLQKAIQEGHIEANFKGVALGDSWVSPIDFLESYGPYLYYFSFLDENAMTQLNQQAATCRELIVQGQWVQATVCWGVNQGLLEQLAAGVNFYNVLSGTANSRRNKINKNRTKLNLRRKHNFQDKNIAELYQRLFQVYEKDDLGHYMNTVVKDKLKIIPSSVTWGGQSGDVFENQREDFMKPVISDVDYLLANTSLTVAIYNGQLDLICDTIGVEKWVNQLKWVDLPSFKQAQRNPFYNQQTQEVGGFSKQYGKFRFYWILRAGHMAPADAPFDTLQVLQDIIQNST